jgi:hypothetical protein
VQPVDAVAPGSPVVDHRACPAYSAGAVRAPASHAMTGDSVDSNPGAGHSVFVRSPVQFAAASATALLQLYWPQPAPLPRSWWFPPWPLLPPEDSL